MSWWDGLRDRLRKRWRTNVLGVFSKSIANGVRDDWKPFRQQFLASIENGEDPATAFDRVFLGS